MARIVFIDTEVNMDTGRVADYGAVDEYGGAVHTGIEDEFISFIGDADYICGHNILNHDLEYIGKLKGKLRLNEKEAIDTLHLSPLLFPKNPYHKLVKDDKLLTEQLNNPVNDSIKAKELFFDELNAYKNLSQNMKDIFNLLLKDSNEFKGFFKYANMNLKKPRLAFWKNEKKEKDILKLIDTVLRGKICENVDLKEFVVNSPIELAYAIAVINSGDDISITPRWVVNVNFL